MKLPWFGSMSGVSSRELNENVDPSFDCMLWREKKLVVGGCWWWSGREEGMHHEHFELMGAYTYKHV